MVRTWLHRWPRYHRIIRFVCYGPILFDTSCQNGDICNKRVKCGCPKGTGGKPGRS